MIITEKEESPFITQTDDQLKLINKLASIVLILQEKIETLEEKVEQLEKK